MNGAEENPKHASIQVEGLFCNMGLRDSYIWTQRFFIGTAQMFSHISWNREDRNPSKPSRMLEMDALGPWNKSWCSAHPSNWKRGRKDTSHSQLSLHCFPQVSPPTTSCIPWALLPWHCLWELCCSPWPSTILADPSLTALWLPHKCTYCPCPSSSPQPLQVTFSRLLSGSHHHF